MDGLEADLYGKVEVLRLDILTEPGRDIAGRFGVRAVPAFILFDRKGHAVEQHSGIPNRDALREAALGLAGSQ